MEKIDTFLKMTQTQLHSYLSCLLSSKYNSTIEDKEAFIYSEGTLPVLLVAHLDTVHKSLPVICKDKEERYYWSPNGIGGDDRCGVYAVMKISDILYDRIGIRPHVMFTHDEETGGRGAHVAANAIKPNVKYIIEIDRKGNDDAVFYSCGNEEFIKYIESAGFKKAYGSFSDISVLSPSWNIASVNISSGYYNAHSSNEYIDMQILEININKIVNILSVVNEDTPTYDYKEEKKVISTSKYDPRVYNPNDNLWPSFDDYYYDYSYDPMTKKYHRTKQMSFLEDEDKIDFDFDVTKMYEAEDLPFYGIDQLEELCYICNDGCVTSEHCSNCDIYKECMKRALTEE